MHCIKAEPRYVQTKGPPLSTEVQLRIDPGDCKLSYLKTTQGVKLGISNIAKYNNSWMKERMAYNQSVKHTYFTSKSSISVPSEIQNHSDCLLGRCLLSA